jgi:hypothetical protein
MLTVVKAQELIEPVYEDRRDKLGYPEVEHVRRVAANVSELARPIALLHDAVEDDLYTFRQLYPLMAQYQFEALLHITRDGTLTYMNYIRMLKNLEGVTGDICREIKTADLKDNMTRKCPANMEGMRQPGGRYWRAWTILTDNEPDFIEVDLMVD